MDISFSSHKFAKLCSQERNLRRKHGEVRTRRILQRLANLKAAKTLADMRNFPGRCHELIGDHADQLALDLDHPYRLIIVPNHNPIPRRDDGGLDWESITAVSILSIEDYHG